MMRILIIAAALLTMTPVQAQDAYPNRPISMVVPFPPGGVADLTGRPTAFAMEKALKQRIIVENKGGAGVREITAVCVTAVSPRGMASLVGRQPTANWGSRVAACASPSKSRKRTMAGASQA